MAKPQDLKQFSYKTYVWKKIKVNDFEVMEKN
jgi:hypothetical protein